VRYAAAPAREDPEDREGEWIIAATGTAIHSIFEGKGRFYE